MSRRVFPFLTIAVLTLMTIPVWAKPNSSDALKTTINLSQPATLNNMKLPAGEYKVTAQGNQAKFERDGKIVAEVPCTWKTLSNKAPYSEIMTKQDQITQVNFSGKTQAIEFSSNQAAGN